jgi:hypothetical protein
MGGQSMTTPLNPEVVRALGRGDLSPHIANVLANDPWANFEARATDLINQSRQARAESERLKSTIHSCNAEVKCLFSMCQCMANAAYYVGEFFMNIARYFASFFRG